MWWNSKCDITKKVTKFKKNQIVKKLKNSKCDNSKTQNVTEPTNPKRDKTQKLKCDKTQRTKCDTTQKLNMWLIFKKNEITLKMWQN